MKVRLRYGKLGKVRFISHRDVARAWERAMRRAGVPVATSGGYTPRQRLSFGLALPVGAESSAEYVDAEIDGDLDVEDLPSRLSAVLPTGLVALAAAACPPGTPSLQESVTSVTWELALPAGLDARPAVARLLTAATLPATRERKGERRTDDVRPLVIDLDAPADGAVMVAELATTGRGLRPAELVGLAFAGLEPATVRVTRTHQWIDEDGTRREVLALPEPVAPPAVVVGA